MSFAYPGERSSKAARKEIQTADELEFEIKRRYERRDVFAGLLWYANFRHWKPGWAAYAYKELFGAWPRFGDNVEPQSIIGTDLEQWCWSRKRK